jgi:hypothetical protein
MLKVEITDPNNENAPLLNDGPNECADWY